ncbi:MAG: acetyltransferase [Candidatus Omnitrophica bacterium]|nr:acetyltransferase [Candidatus Omnitrophota bacterium]
MSKVVIFGAGGGANTAYRYITKDSPHEVVAFTVDGSCKNRDTYHDLPVVEFEDVEKTYPAGDFKMFIVMGFDDMSRLRIQKYNEAKAKGYSFISYVASDIFCLEELQIGQNCFILEKQTINPDVKIGNNVVMWSANHVGDRTIIEDNVWISSHVVIGGDATIGQGSFIGMNATIAHDVSIGQRNFIGAGALISKSTKNESVYVQERNKALGIDSDIFFKMANT